MLDKTFDQKSVEEKHYKRWEDSGVFASDPESNRNPFCIMMPPPNVTGSLHMGHALNMTLQDILTRYNRMTGKSALWQPGTDHAGIATQMVVERLLDKEGTHRRDLGRDAFLERVWEWKEESGSTITSQLRRLGTSPDWERERFTMDDGLSKAVLTVFVQLYKEGLIYKDKRLVNWDPKLHTAISDLEVEQRETKSHMWHIDYPIEGAESEHITIATTRPETMLGDTAVAVHPDDERYKHLIGKFVVLPIVGRIIPIVADDYVKMDQGSGALKITPAHDFNDFEVAIRHDLEMVSIFDKDAKVNENAPEVYQGLDRFEARKKILQELEEMDLINKVDDHVYQLPYGDRSGVVIEPMLTDQWFCDAPTLAKPAIKAVEDGKTEFVPKQWEKTYFEWMYNIQPWCISRQLWWGHQIPAWYGPDGTVFVAETEEDAREQAQAHYGEETVLERDPDVLDTWFSSALWPFSTLGWPDKTKHLDKYYPNDVLITGFDIIFFWVARMMMMGLHFMDDVPFRKVYIHALVRDEKGQKMSKSKGNIIDPLELIDEYGADALRFTLTAMAAQGRDVKLSSSRVEGYRNFATKLWNAARYCEMNECRSVPDFNPVSVEMTLNKWIVAETIQTAKLVAKAIEEFKFNEAASAIYQFVWGTFCDWYLEFTKPVLQDDGGEAQKQETRQTTSWVLDQVLTILNPIMPFITEELFEAMGDRGEGAWLIKSEWPDYPDFREDKDSVEQVSWLIRLISEIRSLRADMNVPAGAKIRAMLKGANEHSVHWVENYKDIILRLARLEDIGVLADDADVPKGSVQSVINEAQLILPIADIVDLDQERDRLKKKIEKIAKDIDVINKKLANEKFLENAPEDVVEEQRDRKKEAEIVLKKLEGALNQLDAA